MFRGIRTLQACLFTIAAVIVGTGIGVFVGREAFLFAVLPMPLPLALVWLSADVRRADEEAASRKTKKEVAPPSTRPATARAVVASVSS